jgi:transcriptional antiterminator Rof (Rho-off)
MMMAFCDDNCAYINHGRGHLKCGTAKDYEFVCHFRLYLILRLKNNNKTAAGTSGQQLLSKIHETSSTRSGL